MGQQSLRNRSNRSNWRSKSIIRRRRRHHLLARRALKKKGPSRQAAEASLVSIVTTLPSFNRIRRSHLRSRSPSGPPTRQGDLPQRRALKRSGLLVVPACSVIARGRFEDALEGGLARASRPPVNCAELLQPARNATTPLVRARGRRASAPHPAAHTHRPRAGSVWCLSECCRDDLIISEGTN